MYIEMEPKEISIKELMNEILSKWRYIAFAMIVFAVIFGIIGYGKSYIAVKNQQENEEQIEKQLTELGEMSNKESAIREVKEKLSDEEIIVTENTFNLDKQLQALQEYQNQSEYMKIDSFNIAESELLFWVSADDDNSYSIGKAYETILTGLGAMEFIAQNSDMTTDAVSELIELDTNNNGYHKGDYSFAIRVLHYDMEKCQTMAEAVLEYANQMYPIMVESSGQHEFKLMNQASSIVEDMNVLKEQKNIQDTINNYRTALAGYIRDLTEDQREYYNLLADKMEEKAETVTDVSAIQPQISVKYIFLGAILGAFISVIPIFASYAFGEKLCAHDDFQSLFQVYQFGIISYNNSGKIDKTIGKLHIGHKKKKHQQDIISQKRDVVLNSIKTVAVRRDLKRIYLIGCNINESVKKACGEIQEILLTEKIETVILDDVLYNADSINELQTASNVILIESAGVNTYREIERQLQMIRKLGIEILGAVIVE